MIKLPIFNVIKYLDKRVLRNIIILISLNVVVSVFLFLSIKHHDSLRIKLQQVDDDYVRARRKIDERPKLIAEKKQEQQIVDEYMGRLIEEREKTELLGNISELAKQCEVAIISVNPKIYTKPLPHGFTSYFKPLMYELALECGYHEFGQFLNSVEHFDTMLVVEEMSIEPSETNKRIHLIKLVLTTYARI